MYIYVYVYICIYKIVWHVWFSGRLSFHRHYHYLNSYTGFQFLIELILSCPLLHTYRALSTQQPPNLASLLLLSNIPRQLRSSISQQLIVHKTKLNVLSLSLRLGSGIFSQKNSRHIYSKLHFHHKCSVVPHSDTDFCTSLFMIMLNDSVLLHF